jgi:transposase
LLEAKKEKSVKRRYQRFTIKQKQELLLEAEKPGNSISLIARTYGVSVSAMFEWRKNMSKGAIAGLSTDEDLVPASQVRELKTKLRELERLLGRKTVEVEILKEAVELGREKKLISHAPLRGVEGFR